jgi:LPS sulfotransferase NodH
MLRVNLGELKVAGVHHLKNLALCLGVIGGHVDYQKFIILGRARTGSNMLRGLLNSHSQIVAFGELFRSTDSIGWDYPGYRSQPQHMLALIRDNPISFLETKVFKEFPQHVSAVGFKIFYAHAQDDQWKPVWSHLRQKKEIKVLHLKRRNILRTHFSLQRVEKTGKWRNATDMKEEKVSIWLDYEECRQAFTRTRERETQYDALFEEHQKMELLYEELSHNYTSEMKRIQHFLGVDCEIVKPITYKQSQQPLSEAIANYYELKERFQGTPWEEFFED